MEEYFIGPNGLGAIRGQETLSSEGVEAGFKFFVVGLENWNEIPSLLQDHIQLAEWIERLRAREADESKGKSKEASLIFRPHIDRLSPNIHYICFRDIDEQRKELQIRFFLTSEIFILLGWNGLSPERLDEWARRGILTSPLELACSLGLRLLRHHQKNLEIIEDQMDLIEEEILIAPRSWQLNRIITLHRRILGLKRSLKAHQNVFAQLKNITEIKCGDLYEELMLEMKQAIDNIYQTHEMIESLREAYQAATDNHANDIMKLLTLLATILLPINLLTSFFGMNFEAMPLIHATYGITIFYALSVTIVMIVMVYFSKKKWLK